MTLEKDFQNVIFWRYITKMSYNCNAIHQGIKIEMPDKPLWQPAHLFLLVMASESVRMPTPWLSTKVSTTSDQHRSGNCLSAKTLVNVLSLTTFWKHNLKANMGKKAGSEDSSYISMSLYAQRVSKSRSYWYKTTGQKNVHT